MVGKVPHMIGMAWGHQHEAWGGVGKTWQTPKILLWFYSCYYGFWSVGGYKREGADGRVVRASLDCADTAQSTLEKPDSDVSTHKQT